MFNRAEGLILTMKLGIDFGTCFSYVAACIGDNINNYDSLVGKDDTIIDKLNGIPTVFYHDSDPENHELVGKLAYERLLSFNSNGIQHIKSLLRKKSPDEVVLQTGGRTFTIRQIIVKILAFLIKNATLVLIDQQSRQNLKLEYLVITVPASAGADSYRGYLRDFAFEAIQEISREVEIMSNTSASKDDRKKFLALQALRTSEFTINLISLIDEPVAVAIKYCIENESTIADGDRILTYDLGGGTFDAAIVEYTPSNSQRRFRVLSQDGAEVGGNDWDSRLLQLALKESNPPITIINPDTIEYDKELMENVVTAKIRLSSREHTSFTSTFDGGYISARITRSKFERETPDLLGKTIKVLTKVITNFERDNKIVNKMIHAIVFSGGASLMPMVKEKIVPLITKKYPSINVHFSSPDRTIAYGAAIYACRPDQTVLVAPHTYGIECLYRPQNDPGFLVPTGSGNILRPMRQFDSLYKGDNYNRIHNILLKGTPIDPIEGYISGEENYCPIFSNQKEMSIRVFEIKEQIGNQKWVDIGKYDDMFRIIIPIDEIQGKSTLERSFSVKIRLLQGGILELFVYDNDRKRQLVEYKMIRI